MKRVCIVLTLMFFQISYGQSERKAINKTLQNYIEGSSYNKLALIKSAFINNATLYLEGREGFKRYTPEEYANFFKDRKSGEFNGRLGKVLSIEQTKDIASARVKISIPKAKLIFIDIFLLKKLKGEWKIISKTATRIDEEK